MSSATACIDTELEFPESIELNDDSIVTSTPRVDHRIPDMLVGNLTEREILAMAPSMVCDRIHWSTPEPMSLTALISDLPFQARTRAWSDGHSRIWVDEGHGQQAREFIRRWCEERDIEFVNMRVESGIPFRDVGSIPGDLFDASS